MTHSEEVSLPLPGGTLHGVLERPADHATGLAVLIHPGSGPTDRDGNQPMLDPTLVNNSLKLLAEGLLQHGIASLRIDKRGIGASQQAAPDEAAMRLETYVTDAVAWLHFLQTRPGFTGIALIGHSEGALIATLAAQRVPVSALVLLAGSGRPVEEVLRTQFAAYLPAPWQQRADQMLTDIIAGRVVDNVPPELWALFRPSFQPYMRSWLAYDPAAELAKVTSPVAIIQGRRDLQVTVGDAERLAAKQPQAKLLLIDGMNHVLKAVPDNLDDNLASYRNPALPLAPALMPALTGFLAQLP